MSGQIKKYPIDQCALYKVSNKSKLEKLLLLESGKLKKLVNSISYSEFEGPKKSGGFRTLTNPAYQLKQVQKRILRLLNPIEKPEWVISSSKGKSYVSNADLHKENDCVLALDISSFFQNCTRDYVYRFFLDGLKTSPDCASLLADLCTWKNTLPQGAPTSQLLSYFAYRNMFEEINRFAGNNGLSFSLYVDDMSFSSALPFSPKGIEDEVGKILARFGHRLSRKKTVYYPKGKPKIITGVVISTDHMLRIPNSLRHQIVKGISECSSVPNESMVQKTLGRINASRMIEPGVFSEGERVVKKSSIANSAAK